MFSYQVLPQQLPGDIQSGLFVEWAWEFQGKIRRVSSAVSATRIVKIQKPDPSTSPRSIFFPVLLVPLSRRLLGRHPLRNQLRLKRNSNLLALETPRKPLSDEADAERPKEVGPLSAKSNRHDAKNQGGDRCDYPSPAEQSLDTFKCHQFALCHHNLPRVYAFERLTFKLNRRCKSDRSEAPSQAKSSLLYFPGSKTQSPGATLYARRFHPTAPAQ